MKETEKRAYSYSGPVYYFGKLAADNWKGRTFATSEAKAVSNLIYQFKKKQGYVQHVQVTLGKKPVLEDVVSVT